MRFVIVQQSKVKMPTRKKKSSSTKSGRSKAKSFTKEENNIATYFKNSLEMENGVSKDEETMKENNAVVATTVSSTVEDAAPKPTQKKLSTQNSSGTNVHARRSLSVPPTKTTRKTKTTSESTDQTKISDFYVVRRSNRTSGQEIKKKEKEELEFMILHRTREISEEHLKVIQILGKGRGVVANRTFSRVEFVVEYAGDLIEHSLAKQRESRYKLSPFFGCYMYYFNANNKQYCVDATEETGRLGRLVNHSRLKPNCATKVVEVQGVPRLILVAIRQIDCGEELLYDYGDRNKESLTAHPWLAL